MRTGDAWEWRIAWDLENHRHKFRACSRCLKDIDYYEVVQDLGFRRSWLRATRVPKGPKRDHKIPHVLSDATQKSRWESFDSTNITQAAGLESRSLVIEGKEDDSILNNAF